MMKLKKSSRLSPAMQFIVLFGVVSLFSDMTHESASSIRGAFFSIVGASAATIGFVSGLGEMVGYSLRYFFGRLVDKTKLYWPLVIVGYFFDVLAVPALALVGEHGWMFACGLLIVQRIGKAIKKPAKDAVLSFAASGEGVGKTFGIQEVLDQIGAFLGPVLLYVAMLFKIGDSTYEKYSSVFALLLIPAVITLAMLFVTKKKFPNPENFEPDPKEYKPLKITKKFTLYLVGISLFAFGFIDYSMIIMHVSREQLIQPEIIPLLYACAMLIDAISALCFGYLYDKIGIKSLIIATLISAPFSVLIFMQSSLPMLVLGVALWGIGMGAQESILKAVVTTMVPKSTRATGYGIFEFAFGIFWFLGSWILGVLYDHSIATMVAISVGGQLAAIVLYLLCNKADTKSTTPPINA